MVRKAFWRWIQLCSEVRVSVGVGFRRDWHAVRYALVARFVVQTQAEALFALGLQALYFMGFEY